MENKIQLSVIVCCYNRAKYIHDVITKLCDQIADKGSYEILLIDNNSTDATPEICKNASNEFPENNICYILETNQGLTFARNRGVKESKAALVSFIDDDGLCNREYVSEIISAFARYPKAEVIGGKVIPIFPECEPPEWSSKYTDGILSKLDIGDLEKPFDQKYPVGCNMAYRKSILEKVGGFNENLVLRSDEKDLFLRLKKMETSFMYIPTIYVEHVISKERVAKSGVIKVSRITGEGEYYRSKSSFLSLVSKFFEYIFKMGAALILAVGFLIIGQAKKAKYIIIARYYVLYGFLNAKRTLNSDT